MYVYFFGKCGEKSFQIYMLYVGLYELMGSQLFFDNLLDNLQLVRGVIDV